MFVVLRATCKASLFMEHFGKVPCDVTDVGDSMY